MPALGTFQLGYAPSTWKAVSGIEILIHAFLYSEAHLLVWPQFLLEGTWLDFDELYAPLEQLVVSATRGLANDSESLFEAVRETPVDLLGKTCGMACAKPEHDLSRFVLEDKGFFDTREEAFERLGSVQRTLLFEAFFGDRRSG